ncbi:hypothetical protein B484DRAFT_430916 [Ochromonadaceae sp. CCMP2298]|nr:hypothetical protein B484DRAFT_430916 [Ochromonadaceae sp. CCMP2298]
MPAPWTALFHTPSLPPLPSLPSLPGLLDVVNVRCSDGEVFPVRRKLLRPCIALTSLVQAGRGKYALGTGGTAGALGTLRTAGITGVVDAGTGIETGTGTGIETGTGTGTGTGTEPETEMDADADAEGNSASIDVHSCTFDRVLLYLEHAARQEAFQFDPLLAPELLTAAVTLGVSGLQQGCERVLGSFQERVRRSPIRLSEVLARNKAGVGGGGGAGMVKGGSSGSGGGVRGETLLLMSGMVLDITRWLPEHPGGSSIIPEQALDVDCTVFFEIYHASRQSFLYLKEFYIGELALEDRLLVPLPRQEQTQASEAFLANLKRVTPWRLDITAMAAFETHKSF